MRILLTGGGGQVAQSFLKALPKEWVVTAPPHGVLDIIDRTAVERAVREFAPQWIVNTAAYTAVDRAENERAAAFAVNATAVEHLAAAARTARARLLQLSTDFVFDGRSSLPYAPGATAQPLNVYGASKLEGERLALAAAPGTVVLRTSWVYAAQGTNFVRTMLRLMAEREEVKVVDDQVGSPTWASGLARCIMALLDLAAPAGIYHWCDAGVASWYDFAVAIQEEALARGLLKRSTPVLPIRSGEFAATATRPPHSVLDSRRTRELTGLAAVHWRQSLRKMLDELVAA